jgi:hypothetical protein
MVYVFDKATGRYLQPQTARKFWYPDFYTTDLGAGPTDLFERILAEYDGKAAPIIDRLIAARGRGFSLTDQERLDLATYAGLLNVRVLSHRTAYQTMLDDFGTKAAQVYADEVSRIAGNAKRRKQARKVRRILAEGSVRLKAPDAGIVSLQAGFPMAAFLFQMRWSLLDRGHQPNFILGDNPASILAPADARNIFDRRVEVAVPLSPRRLLMMNWHAEEGAIHGVDVPSAVLLSAAGPRSDAVLTYGIKAWRTAGRFLFGSSERDLHAVGDLMTNEDRMETIEGAIVPHGRLEESGDWIRVDRFPDPEDYRHLIRRRRE